MTLINILVTLDSNYIKPLKVMLTSLFSNNPQDIFHVFLVHSSLTIEELKDLEQYVVLSKNHLHIINIEEKHFAEAPAHSYYTKEMYYRLLAFKFLPETVERILYLDPDILVINSIKELYHLDISDYLFAASNHDIPTATEINKIRFYPIEIDAYYNSGVLLMNINRIRNEISETDIFNFVKNNQTRLILPDQDVLNALYSKEIKNIDEKLYNYDVRYYTYYKLISLNEWDIEKVIYNTVILHFCGKKKPWNKGYNGEFHALYKHYEKNAFL